MSNSRKNILIWCHGGCFGGGLPSYDIKLRDFIKKQGWKVHSVDFNVNDYNSAIKDISLAVRSITRIYTNSNVILGGISSGALFAHVIANEFDIPAILVCPVIKPLKRHESLPEKFQKLQLKSFHDFDKMSDIETLAIAPPSNSRFIIYGVKDTRAPFQAYAHWLNEKNATIHTTAVGCSGGHEICHNPPLEIFFKGLTSLKKDV